MIEIMEGIRLSYAEIAFVVFMLVVIKLLDPR